MFFEAPLLSYLDSNQDKLIQSQMCYRYTIGHYLVLRCFFLSKAGAKVQPFSELAKFFFKTFVTKHTRLNKSNY